MEPDLLICDEVVSALDVSIQGQILNLLLDIREKRDVSFLFIAHDLKVACYFCDRIGVMYRGELMEEAPAADLYREGRHPYTQLLFSCAAGVKDASDNLSEDFTTEDTKLHNKKYEVTQSDHAASGNHAQNSVKFRGENFDSTSMIPGASCPFAPRCPKAAERCFCEHPELCEIGAGHLIRCFNHNS
jgi:ABC-type dipeptide/oligopeptide/nickel transport system ATPase component